jgi:hypothetical protein
MAFRRDANQINPPAQSALVRHRSIMSVIEA